MIIQDVFGKTIIETDKGTMRGVLEYCAEKGVALPRANLRKARLSHASLDGLKAPGACLWGADLEGADIGFADLRAADLRCASLKETCLAESDLSDSNLQGSYFSGTILEGAVLDRAIISCPSFWDCDLQELQSLDGLMYNHLGEHEIILSSPPLVVRGLRRRLVLTGETLLWGNDLYPAGARPQDVEQALFSAKTAIEKSMQGDILRGAKKPIRKIAASAGEF